MTIEKTNPPCDHCPLWREQKFYNADHEKRIAALEAEIKIIRDFMIEGKFIRYLTMGGGFMSIITLAILISTLLQ
jgi:hypothetical protein